MEAKFEKKEGSPVPKSTEKSEEKELTKEMKKEADKLELKEKEKESEQKTSRLGAIPDDIKKTEEYFQVMTEAQQIKLDKLTLLMSDLVPINPTFKVEKSDQWVAIRKRELENEKKVIDGGIKQLALKRVVPL